MAKKQEQVAETENKSPFKSYKKVKHEWVIGKDGAGSWSNPKEIGSISMEESHANEHNSQFENTGIKYK